MRAATIWMMAAVAMVAGPAAAADDTRLVRTPDEKAMADAFPPTAAGIGVEGRATVRCQVGDDGRARDCAVTSEAPAGLGFGHAALRISGAFRFRQAKGAQPPPVDIPIRFKVPQDSQAVESRGYRPPKSPDDRRALARAVVARVIPTDWLTAKVSAYALQVFPDAPGPGESPPALADARRATQDAIAAGLPAMQEATALELAARNSAAQLQAMLDGPPPVDPGKFMDAAFKGVSPKWVLAQVAAIKADARARFCRDRGCGGG